MKYLKTFDIYIAEGLSESELNRILDKISKTGVNSLSKEEKFKLDSFNGKYDDIKSTDTVTFDKDGNLLVNGKSYTQFSNESPDDVKSVDDNPKKDVDKKNLISNKDYTGNYLYVKKDIENDNYFTLNNDDSVSVVLDKRMGRVRKYYIYFKDITDVKSKCITLKLEYDMNLRSENNFKIYDNFNNEIEFSKLETFLNSNNLTFGDFNHAWYYIEDDFINQGYTNK